ncbi:MAG: hypothetical protein E2590_06215 [Chryseobacterium sp.]|nr:hypothetical protein [Chryseobacterium sp.]
MSEQIKRELSDLARDYDKTPEGEEKKRLKKIIDEQADIIYGKITIEEIINAIQSQNPSRSQKPYPNRIG